MHPGTPNLCAHACALSRTFNHVKKTMFFMNVSTFSACRRPPCSNTTPCTLDLCVKTRPGIHSRASRSQSYCWNTVAGSRLQATVRNSSKRAAASANAASAQERVFDVVGTVARTVEKILWLIKFSHSHCIMVHKAATLCSEWTGRRPGHSAPSRCV